VQRRGGDVHRLTTHGEGSINLTKLAEEFYRSARWLRIFTCRPVQLPRERVLELVSRPRESIESLIGGQTALLAS